MLLRDNLQPTDFADADCRVTRWVDYGHFGQAAYRIWVCRCTAHWFHRHEWLPEGANQSRFDDWIYYGYYPHKKWEDGLLPAPKEDAI